LKKDEEEQCWSRRDFGAAMAGAMFMTIPLSGCLPILALVLRGGLRGAFLRGARFGGGVGMVTLGRGLAVGARAAALTPSGLPRASIVSRAGRNLGRTHGDTSAPSIYVREKQVFGARREGSDLLHYDLKGRLAGRSRDISEDKVEYFPPRSRKSIGYDHLVNGGRLIRQFDHRGNNTGELTVDQNGDEAVLTADNNMENYLKNVTDDPIFRCPEVGEMYDDLMAAERRCAQTGERAACESLNHRWARYEALRKSCD
jgi:hypothetical protein